MKPTKETLVEFVSHIPGATETHLREFLDLLNKYDRARSEDDELELRRLRGDGNGLKEDFSALEADAAEVVRQWEHGSVGLVDEAIGKLMENGRPEWWKKPGTWRKS